VNAFENFLICESHYNNYYSQDIHRSSHNPRQNEKKEKRKEGNRRDLHWILAGYYFCDAESETSCSLTQKWWGLICSFNKLYHIFLVPCPQWVYEVLKYICLPVIFSRRHSLHSLLTCTWTVDNLQKMNGRTVYLLPFLKSFLCLFYDSSQLIFWGLSHI